MYQILFKVPNFSIKLMVNVATFVLKKALFPSVYFAEAFRV